MNPVTVIFGADSIAGRYLSRHLARNGREVVAVARQRDAWSGDGMFLKWDGKTPGPWVYALEGAEAVINLDSGDEKSGISGGLAAESSGHLRAISDAICACKVPPRVWLQSSSIAWYGDDENRGQDEWLGEPGSDAAALLARQREEAFFAAKLPATTRKVSMRMGVLLANESPSVYPIFLRLARLGLGGASLRGDRRVSWIHMEDFLRAVEFMIADPFLDAVVNVTAPECPPESEWRRAFCEAAGVSGGLPGSGCLAPLAARVRGGDLGPLQRSVRAFPTRLRDAGFRWRFPAVANAVLDLAQRRGMADFFHDAPERSCRGEGMLPIPTR
ncbi:MAG: NAD-dependent epimerase/dehydratase family protein [Luteolibacter sp.]